MHPGNRASNTISLNTVPDDYNWEGTRAISTNTMTTASEESSVDEKEEVGEAKKEMTKDSVDQVGYEMASESSAALDRKELQRVFKRAGWLSLLLTFIITIVRSFFLDRRRSNGTS